MRDLLAWIRLTCKTSSKLGNFKTQGRILLILILKNPIEGITDLEIPQADNQEANATFRGNERIFTDQLGRKPTAENTNKSKEMSKEDRPRAF